MRFFVFTLLLFFNFTTVSEAAFVYEQTQPSDEYQLDQISGETIYGLLHNAPHTFSFVVTEESPFSMQIAMSPHEKKHDVSLILVKEVKRGVSEIGRSDIKDTQWTARYDFLRALVLLWGEKYEYTLEPGVYKVEVSSPENNRGYRLVLGQGDASVYKELWYARSVFEVDFLSILFSPFLFIPLGALMGGVYLLWRRKKKSHG